MKSLIKGLLTVSLVLALSGVAHAADVKDFFEVYESFRLSAKVIPGEEYQSFMLVREFSQDNSTYLVVMRVVGHSREIYVQREVRNGDVKEITMEGFSQKTPVGEWIHYCFSREIVNGVPGGTKDCVPVWDEGISLIK